MRSCLGPGPWSARCVVSSDPRELWEAFPLDESAPLPTPTRLELPQSFLESDHLVLGLLAGFLVASMLWALWASRRRPAPTAIHPVYSDVAVLIASKDGGANIAQTIRTIGSQAPVFVVSDGSTDDTALVAEAEGAHVLALAENVGKPAALHRALHELGLLDDYAYIVVLDDDTTVAPDFVHRCVKRMVDGVSIVCGQTLSSWPEEHKWNVLVGNRMYAYWKFQWTIKRGQSAFGAVNCVAGSNSMYRSELLRRVVREDTPYIVDDCYWAHETQRAKLGRIVYAPEALAWVQDPTNLPDWWKQNTRWLWGTFQAMHGHKVLRRVSWFDFWYLVLVVDWAIYVVGGPLLLGALLLSGIGSPLAFLGVYFLGYFGWAIVAAVATKKWRMIVMAPTFVVIDWLYRAVFVYAIFKAIRQPTVESCKWESPTRHQEYLAPVVNIIEFEEIEVAA